MTYSRRRLLKLIGGGTVVAAAAGAGTFAVTRTPHAALAPWEMAGRYADPRKQALSYALLAPNAHNRQPWLVELQGEDTVVLWRDADRDLPETDPFHRQIVISLGCFLEQMRIAASDQSIDVRIDPYPEGENGPVAIATFAGTTGRDPLFDAIMDRRSCKEPFTDQQVTPETAAKLANYATIYTDPEMVSQLINLTWAAWQTETNYPPTMTESVDLMRFGKAEINANPDGIDLGGPFLESLMIAGILTRENQVNPESVGFKQGVAMYRDMLHATPAYAVLTSDGNARSDQIDAGRRWLRLNLATTLFGMSLHPVSQALQEFPQMATHYQRAHDLLAAPGGTVQMLGRLGYGPTTPRTPRWPLETRLI